MTSGLRQQSARKLTLQLPYRTPFAWRDLISFLAPRAVPGVETLSDGCPQETRAALRRISGIGEWTAEYVAMRALGDPDAFPTGDLGLLRAAARLLTPEKKRPPILRPAALRRLADRWRPWRSYAAMHLWLSLA